MSTLAASTLFDRGFVGGPLEHPHGLSLAEDAAAHEGAVSIIPVPTPS